MALDDTCGPHCGISDSGGAVREGHCPCCHGSSLPDQPAASGYRAWHGVPTCTRWYERSGGVRPWEPAALRPAGCGCSSYPGTPA